MSGTAPLIQSILFFTLGFLTAGFLALMVAPAIWRRAVILTRKRIEASVPLTMNEIQADKDRMRAEFAMSTRRLEMSIKTFRDKASTQIIEINRNREELKRLAEERGEKDRAITELEARGSELRTELRHREEQLQRMSARLAETEQALEARALEIERLGQMYDEASLIASNRQIQLVTRESDFERMTGDVGALRVQRKDADKRLREVAAESKAAQEALKTERKRASEAERKVERLLATVADREDKLDRREKELARLREEGRSGARSSDDVDTRLLEAQTDRVKLEAELADLQLQMSTLLSGATGGDVEKAMETLNKDRARLEERMTVLVRENKKLKGELAAIERVETDDWSDERRDSALLREQINDLAAEVVNLTAMLDGPDSPIRQILARPETVRPEGAERIVSLADRVRALQKAASAG
jgi:chromosome segregation ATPase